ncbi:MAG: alpha/beta hydrolase [Pseudomonadota bacterium]
MSVRSEPRQHTLDVDGVGLCYFDWQPAASAASNAPTYLFTHATGFHARCWDAVIRALPTGGRVVAVDLRGHGRSARVAPYDWASFGADLRTLVERLDLRDVVGVGHSMGGHCTVQAAAALPERFQRLVLVDPVIMNPDYYHLASGHGLTDPLEHPISRRKGDFNSWQAMFERFRERDPYSLWRVDVLEDYCRYGVLPAADGGGVELACPPLIEASVYVGTTGVDIRHLLPRIEVPVAVLRAAERDASADRMDFSASPTWPDLAAQFPRGVDLHLPELTHFIPMQAPDLVARCVAAPVAGRAELSSLLP